MTRCCLMGERALEVAKHVQMLQTARGPCVIAFLSTRRHTGHGENAGGSWVGPHQMRN